MKKISLEQLLQESGQETYPEQYHFIYSQIEAHKLIPVRSSPLNGRKPALHLSYWLAEEEPDYREEIEELKFRTVPAIRTDYYLKHLKVYREEARWVRLLNRYLLEQEERRADGLGEPAAVSLNERSFQIWGREKFLQREQGRAVLAHCGVSLEQLRVYGTTEPLAYYSRSRSVPQTILILENKDTFYSMRRYLGGEGAQNGTAGGAWDADMPGSGGQREPAGSAGQRTENPPKILGTEIGTVIYGAGKGILRSFEDFRFCVEPHVNDPRNRICYFGDLDYEGIGIYERLAALFGTGDGVKLPFPQKEEEGLCGTMDFSGIREVCRIEPFVPAYEKMLEKAAAWGIESLPESSGKQNQKLSGLFRAYFQETEREKMAHILESGKYIPQEILNITDF